MYYITDESITQYVKITLSGSPEAKRLLSQMSSCLKSLKKFDDDISIGLKQIKNEINNAIDFLSSKFDKSIYTNEACFVINKYINLFIKYQSLRFSNLTQAKNKVNDFKKIISDYFKQNVPIHVQYHEFVDSIFKINADLMKKLEFKLEALFNYLKNLPNIEKCYIVSNHELIIEMEKLSPETNIIDEYIPQNNFDLMFESYLESNHDLLNKFLQIININEPGSISPNCNNSEKLHYSNESRINDNSKATKKLILNNFNYFLNMLIHKAKQNKNSTNEITNTVSKSDCRNKNNNKKQENNQREFDALYFECLIKKVYHQITSSNEIDQRMIIVLRCAALRFLCNKYYIIHNSEWINKTNIDYMQNCLKILNQTPQDLKIPKEIIPIDSRYTSFQTIMLAEDFKKAINHLFTIQFLTCPIDIWIEIQMSIDLSLKGVKKLINTEAYTSDIAFDDYFLIIQPVFASAQIMSPNALRSFLSYFISILKSKSMDIATISTATLSLFARDEKH